MSAAIDSGMDVKRVLAPDAALPAPIRMRYERSYPRNQWRPPRIGNAWFSNLQVITTERLHLDPVLMAAASSVGGEGQDDQPADYRHC